MAAGEEMMERKGGSMDEIGASGQLAFPKERSGR